MPPHLPNEGNSLAALLLPWYDEHARKLPWRGQDMDPYRVWLSEIMLQQTTVAAVIPYYTHFITRWPNLEALAKAPEADILAAWAGLGYYSRARNLIACAQQLVENTSFPKTEAELRTLKGIGPYTAAAIACFAFNQRAVVIDANVERVMARLHALSAPPPATKRTIAHWAAHHTPHERCGDYAQALMDLGATLCKPLAPLCDQCPVQTLCAGKSAPESYPPKRAKKLRPERSDSVFWLSHNERIFLIRRPKSGVLGGMRALPCGDAPLDAEWRSCGSIRHIFTHFALTLNIYTCDFKQPPTTLPQGEWWPLATIHQAGLPTLFKKVAARVQLN
jgi:A/G-specific adenine glycosylase